MVHSVKLTSIGNSTGIILPKELLAILGVDKGDTLNIVRTRDGVTLSKHDDEFSLQMEIGRKIMREDYDVLRRLAE